MESSKAGHHKSPRSASTLDCYIGTLVKTRREQLGISQLALAETLGLSFQQVQKYERGLNRISAGRLFELSKILQVDIQWFFQGMPREDQPELGEASSGDKAETHLLAPATALEILASVEGSHQLLTAFAAIKSKAQRRTAISMMEMLGDGR
jgi:transcriptional regulator with XRE-family HTH domain